MEKERYQEYLENSGMPKNSVAGREVWDEQIRRMHDEAREVLEAIGLVES